MDAEYITEPAHEVPVIRTDVFIAGAGTAGCIAAIAAARQGASVILAEKSPVPGGTLTNGGIGISSFYNFSHGDDDVKQIVGGIPYELAERLTEANGSTGFLRTAGDKHHVPYRIVGDHEVYKGVISQMLIEAGVRVFLQTSSCRALVEDGLIRAVFIENKDGRSAVVAKQYIDATGDGDLARFANVPQTQIWQHYGEVCGGPNGLVFGMAGIDVDEMLEKNTDAVFRMGAHKSDVPGIESNRFAFTYAKNPEKYREFATLGMNYFTSIQSIHRGELTYINNSKGPDCDVTSAESLSRAEMEARITAMKFANALKKLPGCEHSYLSWASTFMGVRASWITKCDYAITQADISGAHRFDDEIGLYGFNDLSPKDDEKYGIPEPGFYGFPYRMILPQGIDNLYMAGRCVTEEITAHMSTRNTVGCMLMGNGAGVAAALCAAEDKKSRELPYGELRKALLAQGTILDA